MTPYHIEREALCVTAKWRTRLPTWVMRTLQPVCAVSALPLIADSRDRALKNPQYLSGMVRSRLSLSQWPACHEQPGALECQNAPDLATSSRFVLLGSDAHRSGSCASTPQSRVCLCRDRQDRRSGYASRSRCGTDRGALAAHLLRGFRCSSSGLAYYELNFAPSTQWAAYWFSGYRTRDACCDRDQRAADHGRVEFRPLHPASVARVGSHILLQRSRYGGSVSRQ